jgi:hypothetical protein
MASGCGRCAGFAIAGLSLLLSTTTVMAQTEAPASPPSPPPPPAAAPRIDVGGYVDVYYGYNFDETDPALRSFDVQHNAFSLSAADVSLSKTPTAASRVGFTTDVFFGRSADLTASFEPASDGKEIYKNLKQAYLSLLTGKVQWDAGKFVTPMGAELLESQSNWNYTRSILFGYAVPLYHLGVRASWTVDPRLTVTGMVVNGWNNASETNGEKTVHASLTLKPSSSLTWIANYMVGREAPEPAAERALRHLFDSTLTYALTPKLSLMANVDYGAEGAVKWGGIAGYAKYVVTPAWTLVGRYEYVDDSRGGFMTIGGKAQSLTLTSDHLIAGALRARLEYRLDHVDRDFFRESDGSLVRNQPTLTVGVVYAWATRI